MLESGRETPSIGAVANRAFLVDGDPGGDSGARFVPPAFEGLTSWVTYVLPRETEGIVEIVARRLTKRGDGDRLEAGTDSTY